MQPGLKFSIITPTLLRPSLEQTCLSIQNQSYTNWEHLIVVDDPKANIQEYIANHPTLVNPHRSWYQCSRNHHNVGHTCRHETYPKLDPDTDYILYLDDDNYYIGEALSILNEELTKRSFPQWGTFPMFLVTRNFIDPNPRLNHVDTNQIYTRLKVNDVPAQWPNIDRYATDGVFVDSLTKLVPPTILSNLPIIVHMPIRSYGSPVLSSTNKDSYSVVIPNRFPDVIQPLLDSLELYQAKPLHIVIVRDNHTTDYGPKFDQINIEGDFVFARSANLGIAKAAPNDVILVNDDVRLTQMSTFENMFRWAYSDPSIGILSPLIDGGCGNVYMDANRVQELWKTEKLQYRRGSGTDYVSFVCVYLKRQMLDQIGLMDENFTTYGRDDADMCIRAHRAGWKTAIVRDIQVIHGSGGKTFRRGGNWNSSFVRTDPKNSQPYVSDNYFYQKYPEETHSRRWPQPYTRPPLPIARPQIIPNTSRLTRSELKVH